MFPTTTTGKQRSLPQQRVLPDTGASTRPPPVHTTDKQRLVRITRPSAPVPARLVRHDQAVRLHEGRTGASGRGSLGLQFTHVEQSELRP